MSLAMLPSRSKHERLLSFNRGQVCTCVKYLQLGMSSCVYLNANSGLVFTLRIDSTVEHFSKAS
jgi:hypothetical protein